MDQRLLRNNKFLSAPPPTSVELRLARFRSAREALSLSRGGILAGPSASAIQYERERSCCTVSARSKKAPKRRRELAQLVEKTLNRKTLKINFFRQNFTNNQRCHPRNTFSKINLVPEPPKNISLPLKRVTHKSQCQTPGFQNSAQRTVPFFGSAAGPFQTAVQLKSLCNMSETKG